MFPDLPVASSTISGTTAAGLQYYNMYCHCGRVAAIKVSTTKNNPLKLFYTCEIRSCRFFQWAYPISTQPITYQITDDEVNSECINRSEIHSEIKTFHKKLNAVDNKIMLLLYTVGLLLVFFFHQFYLAK